MIDILDITNRGDHRRFRELMAAVVRGANEGLKSGTAHVAQRSRARISESYKKGSPGAPPAAGTIYKRMKGKRGGLTPSVRRFGSRRSLYRSGTLSKNIMVSKIGNMRFAVHVRQGILSQHTGSNRPIPLDVIAQMQENGYTITTRLTPASLAYLIYLYGNLFKGKQKKVSGGTTSRRSGGTVWRKPPRSMTLRTLVIRVPNRSNWAMTFSTSLGGAFMEDFHLKYHQQVTRYLSNSGFLMGTTSSRSGGTVYG